MGLKLKDLAKSLGGEVQGDGEVMIERVAPIDSAGKGEITFVANPRYISFASTTGASAIIVSPQLSEQLSELQKNLLITKNPYLAHARAVKLLMVRERPLRPGIHASAVIAEDAELGKDVEIGPHVVVEQGATIGARVLLMAGAFVGPRVSIGEESVIHANASLYHDVKIGRRCIIHSGVVIGSDGFGWAPDGERYEAIPQVGATILGDDVSIGAGSIVNRGALGNTVVGNGTKIDSLVILSHNVEVGENSLFVSQVGISGSVKIGKHCTFGGQVGVAGHVKIGENVQVAAQAGVNHDLAANGVYLGAPAKPIKEMRRTFAAFNKLPDLRKEIKHAQKCIDKLSTMLGQDVSEMKAQVD